MSSTVVSVDDDSMPEPFAAVLRDNRTRPERIEDLWRRNTSYPDAIKHLQAENLEFWVTGEEISELLNDEERLGQIVKEFTSNMLELGVYCQKHNKRLGSTNTIFINNSWIARTLKIEDGSFG